MQTTIKYFLRLKKDYRQISLPIGLSLLLLFNACQSNSIKNSIVDEKTTISSSVPIPFTTNVSDLQLRAEPNTKSVVLGTLAKNTKLIGLGVESEHASSIRLSGVLFDEPWQQVKTEEGLVGWVYGGGLTITVPDSYPKAQNNFLQHRLRGIFGPTLAADVQQYQTKYHAINSSKDFAEVYRMGKNLRDSVVQVLHTKMEMINPTDPTDLSWLEQAMPGFKTQLVAEATQFYLFFDYKQLEKKAMQTPGTEDDAFVDLSLAVYADSVEHIYPSWFTQTWDYGGHSLLGTGKHLNILQKIDPLQRLTTLFHPELATIKSSLLDDITAEWVTYWEPKNAIQKELKEIIKNNFSCLNAEEQLLLQRRNVVFENPTENSISVNQKVNN